MATPTSGLSLVGGNFATEPITGNSLDKFIRSSEGLTANQGQSILGTGQGNVAAGQQTTNQGITALGPALSFLTNLVQGNQADIAQAAQPEIDTITQQFDQIRNLISLQPRGGGKATALAEAPFQKAGDIQRTEAGLRSQAVGQLSGLGTSLAQIGLGQSNVGLSESGLGLNLEQLATNTALTKQGLDYGQATPIQSFGQFTQALSNLI